MNLTKDQSSLLLYLETRIVDHAGRVAGQHMNAEDVTQAKTWAETGYIGYGRIASDHCNSNGALWVTFSDQAWEDAHRERRARAERMLKTRNYRTTAEKRAAPVCSG